MKGMNKTFAEALDSFAIIYSDDIVIFSRANEAHSKNLKGNRFKVKSRKYSFLMREIEFLRLRVTPTGIAVDNSKVKAICQMGSPEMSQRAAQHLDLFNQKFIPQCAEIAALITALLKYDTEFKWGLLRNWHGGAWRKLLRM